MGSNFEELIAQVKRMHKGVVERRVVLREKAEFLNDNHAAAGASELYSVELGLRDIIAHWGYED